MKPPPAPSKRALLIGGPLDGEDILISADFTFELRVIHPDFRATPVWNETPDPLVSWPCAVYAMADDGLHWRFKRMEP
jgi:hypothetical protein